MPIVIQVIREDMTTVVTDHGTIPFDDDFRTLLHIAKEMGLTFIYTIDPAGVTVIGQRQQPIFKEQLIALKARPEINQQLLDKLYNIAAPLRFFSFEYIKFTGIR